MMARCARAGNLQKAAQERAVLDGFAPDCIASLFRGENRVLAWSARVRGMSPEPPR
jgi:hypothetical protein